MSKANHPKSATQSTQSPQAERSALEAAYRRVEPHAKALAAEMLRPVTVDVIEATRTARSALAYAEEIRETLKRELPHFDLAPVDRLADDCAALTLAQERYTNQKSIPAVDIQKLESKAVEVRAKRLADLEPMVVRSMISRSEIDAIRSGTGREDLLSDLRAIERSLLAGSKAYGARFWVSEDEIVELSATIRALDEALQRTRDADESARERVETRQRLFTLLALDYDQLRRAASYLLWAQDGALEKAVPSLYVRSERATKSEPKNEPNPAKPEPLPQPRSRTGSISSDAAPQHDVDPNGIAPQDDPYTNP